MSDLMLAMPFAKLIEQAITEYRQNQSVFNVKKLVFNGDSKRLPFTGNRLENPLGVAAGPQTQLAQNLVACYVGGARFLELKTVQKLYGEDLGIPRPCIRANDEAYNVEWSSEFSPREAMEEYIKAWVATKVLAKEFGFGDPDGFAYNMSVGYDLAGIQSEAVDAFLNGMNDASETECFKACKQYLLDNLHLFEHVDAAFVEGISPHVATSISLSTMHGCPAHEIEKITSYLLVEKKFNTYLKCNPTLLGFDYVRNLLNEMGYDYLDVDPHQFEVDLKLPEALVMIRNLQVKAREVGRHFGVKLSNTMPVGIHHDELPGSTMYMSGKSLYPLTISLARLLRSHLDENLEISYSGGADQNNIVQIFRAGIYPITVCTVLLQPQGYEKLQKLNQLLQAEDYPQERYVRLDLIEELVAALPTNKHYCKSEAQRKKYEQYQPCAGTSDKSGLTCRVFCQNCINVCPNRANTKVETASGKWILHLDDACNECGNCHFWCVQPCQPYRDRLTLFSSRDMMQKSSNAGFYVEGETYYVRLDGEIKKQSFADLPTWLQEVVSALQNKQAYLLK